MHLLTLLLLSSVSTSTTSASPVATSSVSRVVHTEAAYFSAMAKGSSSLHQKNYGLAALAFEQATKVKPQSARAHHHLAISLSNLNRNQEALDALAKSAQLGNRSIEADELRALLLIRENQIPQARAELAKIESLPSALLGMSLNVSGSAPALYAHLGEVSRAGVMTTSVLAASAASRGLALQAHSLATIAQDLGHEFNQALWSNAMRDLVTRINEEQGALTMRGRLKTTFDHVKNPEFKAAGQTTLPSATRFSFAAEAALAWRFDTFRWDSSVFALQRIYLAQNQGLSDYAINGLVWANRFTIPLNQRPNATRLHLSLRVRDLYADNFRVHYANNIEGGPSLRLPLGSSSFIELGILGTATDFIDRSPPDDVVSSQNRDLVGQRAFIELAWANEDLSGDITASFLRDDARGEAFDMNGLSLSGRILADLSGGLYLRTGAGVGLGRFGPVGEVSVLGAAAIRNEFRLYGEIAVLVRLADWLQLSLENHYLQNAGRTGHAYTDNILSFGVEVQY